MGEEVALAIAFGLLSVAIPCLAAWYFHEQAHDSLQTLGAIHVTGQGWRERVPSGHVPAADSAESIAWVAFLEECQRVITAHQAGDQAPLRPRLFEAAAALQTRTGRVLARIMITRIAERLATPTIH